MALQTRWTFPVARRLSCLHPQLLQVTSYKLQEVATPTQTRDAQVHFTNHRGTQDALFRRISPVVLDAQTNFTPASDVPMQFIPEPRPVLTLNDTVNCLQSFS